MSSILSTTIRIANPGSGFNFNNEIGLYYDNGIPAGTLNTSSVNTTTEKVFFIEKSSNVALVNDEVNLNSNIVLKTTGNNASTGSAQVSLTVTYVIHNLNISI